MSEDLKARLRESAQADEAKADAILAGESEWNGSGWYLENAATKRDALASLDAKDEEIARLTRVANEARQHWENAAIERDALRAAIKAWAGAKAEWSREFHACEVAPYSRKLAEAEAALRALVEEP